MGNCGRDGELWEQQGFMGETRLVGKRRDCEKERGMVGEIGHCAKDEMMG